MFMRSMALGKNIKITPELDGAEEILLKTEEITGLVYSFVPNKFSERILPIALQILFGKCFGNLIIDADTCIVHLCITHEEKKYALKSGGLTFGNPTRGTQQAIDYVLRVKIDSGFLTVRQGSFIPSVEMWTGKVSMGISSDEVVMVDDDQFLQLWEYYGNDDKLTDELIGGLNEQEKKILNILT